MPEHDLPRLSELLIETCPNLASNLIFPSLEKLKLNNVNEGLLITCVYPQVSVTKQREMITDNLKSLRISYVTELTLQYCGDMEVERFLEALEQSCASSLLTLEINSCAYLKRLSGLEYLTSLQELKLSNNEQLCMNEDDEEPWKSFHSLRKLNIYSLQKIKSSPKGMKHLTSLQDLSIYYCHNLEGLPQWMSSLSSLQSLVIDYCNGIKSFPKAIKDLTSLKSLTLTNCSDLIER